jgi:hypothetical protein
LLLVKNMRIISNTIDGFSDESSLKEMAVIGGIVVLQIQVVMSVVI